MSISLVLLLFISFISFFPVQNANADLIVGNNHSNTITYIDPSYTTSNGVDYIYRTSFGVYEITYLPTLKLYSVSFKNVDTIVSLSALVVLENSLGSWLPINKQPNPNRFTLGAPVFITSPTGERFAITQTLNYQDKSAKETLGELTFIIAFTKSVFPKISVALNKVSYQVDPLCLGTGLLECERETFWNKVGLKDLRWVWAIAPASGYDKYQSQTRGEVSITTASSIVSDMKSARADFKGPKNWYADWSSVGLSDVSVGPVLTSILNQPILLAEFSVNMAVIDPTFGLTSTGSTSYPTAKAITANGNAQIDTAQSKFGGASGQFASEGDYLTLADSADWYFSNGNLTIDLWFNFTALPTSTNYYVLVGQRVDTSNRWRLYFYNNAGTYQWRFRHYTGSTTADIDVTKTAATTNVNTWYHVEVDRAGNSFYIFQGGTQCGTTVTDTDDFHDIAGTLYIGSDEGVYGSPIGHLDEIRITKGIARHTSNFTPPTARYDRDSSTVLLLHNDGADTSTTFLDDVSTGQGLFGKFTLTETGTPTGMSVYSHAAGNMRLTIFTDSSGPSSKACETGDTAVSASAWTSPNISGCGSLGAADYWLGLEWNPGAGYLAGPSYTVGGANTGYRLYMAYGAFPASGAGGALTAENYSIYVTYGTTVTTTTSGTTTVFTTVFGNTTNSVSTTLVNYATVTQLATSTTTAVPGATSTILATSTNTIGSTTISTSSTSSATSTITSPTTYTTKSNTTLLSTIISTTSTVTSLRTSTQTGTSEFITTNTNTLGTATGFTTITTTIATLTSFFAGGNETVGTATTTTTNGNTEIIQITYTQRQTTSITTYYTEQQRVTQLVTYTQQDMPVLRIGEDLVDITQTLLYDLQETVSETVQYFETLMMYVEPSVPPPPPSVGSTTPPVPMTTTPVSERVSPLFMSGGALRNNWNFPSLSPGCFQGWDISAGNLSPINATGKVVFWVEDASGNTVYNSTISKVNVDANQTLTDDYWAPINQTGRYTLHAILYGTFGSSRPVQASIAQEFEVAWFTLWKGAITTWFLILTAAVMGTIYFKRRDNDEGY